MDLAPEIVAAFLTGVAGPIAVNLVKSRLDKKKEKDTDLLIEEVEFATLIEGKLEEIKTELNADRVWITQFHNGGYYYPTGRSIQKFSMFYEVVSVNTPSIKMIFQNIPISLFSSSNNQLLEYNRVAIPDFKDKEENLYGLKHMAEENGTKSLYLLGIRCINDKLIGTLGIEYTKRKTTLDDEDITNAEIFATSIGGVLATHLRIKPLNQQ